MLSKEGCACNLIGKAFVCVYILEAIYLECEVDGCKMMAVKC